MSLLLLVLCSFAILRSSAGILKKRPENGVGKLLISQNPDSSEYNSNRLMVFFDLECINTHSSFSLLHSSSASKFQHSNLNSLISSHYPCLSHTLNELTGEPRHFQLDSQSTAISFLDIDAHDSSCLNAEDVSFDYNEHCVHMFTYEPIYRPDDLSSFSALSSDAFECTTLALGATLVDDDTVQWGLDATDSALLDTSFSRPARSFDNGVDLYILDSGVQSAHQDFYENQVVTMMGDGPAYFNDGTNEFYSGHGTHVAGIAAGRSYGHAPNTTIYDYRVCLYGDDATEESQVSCYLNLIMTALDAINTRLSESQSLGDGSARRAVINLSLGGEKDITDYYYEYFFELIIGNGGIPVTSAGNVDLPACEYAPGWTDLAITVGSFDSDFEKSWFSNYGDCVDTWAPGSFIYSAEADTSSNTEYGMRSGTSMASPGVAGNICNLLWVDPTLTFREIKQILRSSVTTITTDECDEYTCQSFIYTCNTLPRDYYESLSETPSPNTNYVEYPGVTEYDCNFVAVSTIDLTRNDTDNYNNYYVQETVYQPTDKCIASRLDENLFYSYSYRCTSDSKASFVIWNNYECSGDGYEALEIESGLVDGDSWFFVDCSNSDHRKNEEETSYDGSDCDMVFRFWITDEFGAESTVGGQFDTTCIYNESNAYFADDAEIIGACNYAENGTWGEDRSYEYSCDDTHVYVDIYQGKGCDASKYLERDTYIAEACYGPDEDGNGFQLEILECGKNAKTYEEEEEFLDEFEEWMESTFGVTGAGALALIIIIPILIFIAIVACCVCFFCLRKRRNGNEKRKTSIQIGGISQEFAITSTTPKRQTNIALVS